MFAYLSPYIHFISYYCMRIMEYPSMSCLHYQDTLLHVLNSCLFYRVHYKELFNVDAFLFFLSAALLPRNNRQFLS